MTNQERIPLGTSDLLISALGIGVWAWGDRMYWGYGTDYDEADVRAAFKTCLDAGINFFDTAEMYGFGRSEQIYGQFVRSAGEELITATKFLPFPWRVRKTALRRALRGSLRRLAMEQVELYQIHWPMPPVSVETWANAMADAVEAGQTQTVGVSNYNVEQTRRAHATLEARGIPLVSNQVLYNLIDRRIERNGLLETCRVLGVTVIAYSPIAQGVLTGKYTPENPLPGSRSRRYGRALLEKVQPLIDQLREIGQAHGGKTPAQVAINWTMRKGTVPIPGVKNTRQAEENIGALGWELTGDEVAALDKASDAL
jgi:aryl-alcohol dehydrogenase-like predicted oxidoreductase